MLGHALPRAPESRSRKARLDAISALGPLLIVSCDQVVAHSNLNSIRVPPPRTYSLSTIN